MKFEEILKELRNGKLVRRTCYRESLIIFMQVPAYINTDNTWHMKSLPNDMKIFLKQNEMPIEYKNQFIIYDTDDCTATYHVFDGDDINAEDWVVIDPFTYSYE